MAFTWTNSIKSYFGSGASMLSEQGVGGLKAILNEIVANCDDLDTRVDRVEGIIADEGLTSTTAAP